MVTRGSEDGRYCYIYLIILSKKYKEAQRDLLYSLGLNNYNIPIM